MQTTQQPDTKPGPYYVSAFEAGKTWLMAGPYTDHAAALSDVDKARTTATDVDPRAWWKAWGTVRVEGSAEIGVLNRYKLI